MGYYSFVAVASQEVHLPEHLLCLDHGLNVFSAVVDDLERFQDELRGMGVTVQRCYQLSEDLEPTPGLLPGNTETLTLPVRFLGKSQ